MNNHNNDLKFKIEKIISNLEETKDCYQSSKEKLSDWLVEIGSQEEAVEAQQDLWRDLKQVNNLPGVITESGKNMSQEMLRQSQYITDYISSPQIDDCISTAGTASDSMGGILSSGATLSYPPDQLPQSYYHVDSVMKQRINQKETYSKLEKIDTSLAETYENAWKSLRTTVKDKTRGPMFLIREVVRRLYHYFAPDGKVRDYYSSNKRATKEIEKDGIKRKHRIEYIVSIIDPSKKETFLTEEESYLKIYSQLSKAHKAGELDQKKTKGLLYQVDALIRLLLESLD